ncbi:hypothetical protein ACFL0T_07385 [Candidatus Omnitrophota bacterium]
MKFEEFIKKTGDLPVIDSEILASGMPDPKAIKVQLCRWQRSGKVIQLKRGIYILAENYRKVNIYDPYIASILKKPSYLSLEKALEFHNLIPEGVSVYTSVTTKRTAKYSSRLGVFDYRHIKSSLFWGYESVTVDAQTAFIASPEKALLDFIYLKGMKIDSAYLNELRLQNVERVNLQKLLSYAKRFQKPGILMAAEIIRKYINSYQKQEKTL